jgi:large subunit ribosomal protein L23
MAFLGIKKSAAKAPKAVAPKEESKAIVVAAAPSKGLSHVIIRPHITEKAGLLAGSNVYTFEIAPSANKALVSAAIKDIFKVTPVKVAIANIKSKARFVRGKVGKTAGGKKAYVYLRKGDKIEFI